MTTHVLSQPWQPVSSEDVESLYDSAGELRDGYAYAWHFNFSPDPFRDPITEPTHRIVKCNEAWRYDRADEFGSWLCIHTFRLVDRWKRDHGHVLDQDFSWLVLALAGVRPPDFFARLRS